MKIPAVLVVIVGALLLAQLYDTAPSIAAVLLLSIVIVGLNNPSRFARIVESV